MMSLNEKLFDVDCLLAGAMVKLIVEATSVAQAQSAYYVLQELVEKNHVEEEIEMPEVSPEEALEAVVAEMLKEAFTKGSTATSEVDHEELNSLCSAADSVIELWKSGLISQEYYNDNMNTIFNRVAELNASANSDFIFGTTAHKVGA